MQGTWFTLARLITVPTIKNLMIVRCVAVDNYVFLRESQLVYGWIVIWGSGQELHDFTVVLTGARLNLLIPTT